jgi:DNA excision repair protein ERCC-2
MLQAPPGAGKTAAVLLGALQVAWRTDARLFFATARNTQQEMAESTLRSMAGRGPEITAVTLRARSRVCLLASRVPGVGARVACGPETCPYAVRYHDRMREGGVIEALLRQGPLTSSGLREFAEARTLCPYQLALDLAPFVDVVVGDYNYVFDPDTASLGLTRETGDPWIVVVDEAHNLADRALQWGSPSLSGPRIEAISDALREAAPCFEAHADRLDRLAGLLERAGSLGDPVWIGDGVHRLEALDPAPFEEILEILESSSLEYLRLALTHACYPLKPATTRARETGDRDGDSVEAGGSDAFLDLGWALSLFVRRLQTIGPETVILHRREGRARADLADPWSLKLLCRDPSPTLGPAFEALAGAVLMSATLDPVDFHRDLLGLDPLRTSFHRVEPFFDPARLRVIVAPSVSTVFRERERHREATAEIVREVALAIPGNCALLFSSFALRDAVCDGIRLPGRRLVHQQPGMGDGDRERILAALRAPDLSEPLVLLGVLGGIFAEGVDLPGDALLGVVIVGPALPTVSLERELLREWFQHRWQDGFKLAYLVPGMSRVLQAAGRVTRSEADRGVVVLVDRRFLQNDYTVFFPPTWTPLRSTRPWTQVATFFAEVGGTGHALDTGATRSISYALSNLLEPVS